MESHPAGSGAGGPADFLPSRNGSLDAGFPYCGRPQGLGVDPATDVLRQCVEMCRDDKAVDPVVQLRLREMLEFVERISRWYDQMIAPPRSTSATLIKVGRRNCALARPRR